MMQSLAYHVSVLRKDFSNYCGEKLEEMGLTPGLLYFVTYVARHPGCSPKELAQALKMDNGHTARSITKLAEGGFLVQEPNPRDKRAHVLRLTPKGETAAREGRELFYRWDQEVTAVLTPEQREQLMSLMAALSASRGGGGLTIPGEGKESQA